MFHNNKLQSIHEASKDVIKYYHEILDKLSADIRLLEEVLRISGVSECTLELDNGHYLIFENSRLLYSKVEKNLTASTPKPLIEQKATVRLQVADQLPVFFEKCMHQIKSGVNYVSTR